MLGHCACRLAGTSADRLLEAPPGLDPLAALGAADGASPLQPYAMQLTGAGGAGADGDGLVQTDGARFALATLAPWLRDGVPFAVVSRPGRAEQPNTCHVRPAFTLHTERLVGCRRLKLRRTRACRPDQRAAARRRCFGTARRSCGPCRAAQRSRRCTAARRPGLHTSS